MLLHVLLKRCIFDCNYSSFLIPYYFPRPKSRGVLRLRSNSTTDHPILEGFYLKDQNDVDVMVEALKFSHSLKVR